METRARHLAVGGFVLLLVVGLVGFVLWVTGADFDDARARYAIRFTGSVTGLQEASQVRYKGVPVGLVTAIAIDPADPERIRVVIEIDPLTPVKADSLATLEFVGITGIAYVQISAGSPGAPALTAGPDGALPVIPSQPSAYDALFEGFASTPELMATLNSLGRSLNALLSDENRAAVASILVRLDAIAEDIDRTADALPETIKALRTLTERLEGLAAAAETQIKSIGPSLTGTLDTATGSLKVMSTEVSAAAEEATQVLKRLEGLLADNQPALSSFASEGLYELTRLLGELRDLAGTLGRLTGRLERDPGDIFFGGSGRGVEVQR